MGLLHGQRDEILRNARDGGQNPGKQAGEQRFHAYSAAGRNLQAQAGARQQNAHPPSANHIGNVGRKKGPSKGSNQQTKKGREGEAGDCTPGGRVKGEAGDCAPGFWKRGQGLRAEGGDGDGVPVVGQGVGCVPAPKPFVSCGAFPMEDLSRERIGASVVSIRE